MAIGFNVYRNRKGNRDGSAGPNAHGLGGGQRVPANHHIGHQPMKMILKMKMKDMEGIKGRPDVIGS